MYCRVYKEVNLMIRGWNTQMHTVRTDVQAEPQSPGAYHKASLKQCWITSRVKVGTCWKPKAWVSLCGKSFVVICELQLCLALLYVPLKHFMKWNARENTFTTLRSHPELENIYKCWAFRNRVCTLSHAVYNVSLHTFSELMNAQNGREPFSLVFHSWSIRPW